MDNVWIMAVLLAMCIVSFVMHIFTASRLYHFRRHAKTQWYTIRNFMLAVGGYADTQRKGELINYLSKAIDKVDEWEQEV